VAVRVDVLYTLIHRLGLFRVVLFFAVDPLWNAAFGHLAVAGFDGWHLDQIVGAWWPGVLDTALVGFVVYLLVFDLANYLIHRAQHRWAWWWALHALHHSQRHMTMWTDSRNHLLDDLLRDVLFVLLARVIGVAPGQFVALVACSQLVENLSHANLRWHFGALGERLLVGPRFHRIHHAAGVGHESQGAGSLGGHNFAVLFPFWDLAFGTARFEAGWPATGIRDQWPEAGGRDYGRGFWSQQALGLKRLVGRA
jgi:sterol desaturase/sphingolipid hydroxylase (fatty acid hydroxylase superfamily)